MATEENKKIYALDLTNEEWIDWLNQELGQPKFRAGQITQWLWQKHTYDADEMTNLSKELREALCERVDFALPQLMFEQRSKDGTRKFLWRFADGQAVESVLLRQGERYTACVSTQVGCPLQCVFCATGLSGYERNLSAGEIASQFLAMETMLGREINNVVYMGMGEPFLNTENVLKSVRMLNDPKMRNLGIRHITISTSGIIPGIMALMESGLGVRLAISLHAVDDELRGELMPVNQRYPLEELRAAMETYQERTGDRVTIEYALFGGVNDSVEDARALVRYLRGIHVFVNLIPFNSVDERFEKPTAEAVLKFRKVLDTAGFETVLREEQGADIDAACGQLRRKAATGEAMKLDARPYDILKREPKKAAPKAESTRVRRPKNEKTFESAEKKTYERKPYGKTAEKRGEGKRKPFDPAKTGRAEEKTAEKKRAPRSTEERDPKKRAFDASKPAPAKRRKTDRPEQEQYRSGKKKEERPTYKGRRGGEEEEQKTPRKEPWFEGALHMRKKTKKTEAPKGRRPKAAKQAGNKQVKKK